jgi:hypothetical protein
MLALIGKFNKKFMTNEAEVESWFRKYQETASMLNDLFKGLRNEPK